MLFIIDIDILMFVISTDCVRERLVTCLSILSNPVQSKWHMPFLSDTFLKTLISMCFVGADCVITVPHPHTSEVLNEFYTLFYSSFMLSCDVCTSLNQAVSKVSSAL